MHTEEELFEVVDLLVESYGFSEEEAIDLVNEAYEEKLLTEGEKWERTKELAGEFNDGNRTGRMAAAVGTIAGVGLGAAAIGAKQLKKDLKQARKTRRNIKNIRKTGRRLSEGGDLARNVARGAGVAVGAYGVAKALDPAVRYVGKKLKQKTKEHDEKVRERNNRKEQEAILEYRKNKIKKALKRK